MLDYNLNASNSGIYTPSGIIDRVDIKVSDYKVPFKILSLGLINDVKSKKREITFKNL
jgi:hypothetical protein